MEYRPPVCPEKSTHIVQFYTSSAVYGNILRRYCMFDKWEKSQSLKRIARRCQKSSVDWAVLGLKRIMATLFIVWLKFSWVEAKPSCLSSLLNVFTVTLSSWREKLKDPPHDHFISPHFLSVAWLYLDTPDTSHILTLRPLVEWSVLITLKALSLDTKPSSVVTVPHSFVLRIEIHVAVWDTEVLVIVIGTRGDAF